MKIGRSQISIFNGLKYALNLVSSLRLLTKSTSLYSCVCILLLVFNVPLHADGFYTGLSASTIQFKTGSSDISHKSLSALLGYSFQPHHVELQYNASVKDVAINQLQSQSPASSALFYLYDFNMKSSFKILFRIGVSSTDIELIYPSSPVINETYSGVSYGITFEESFGFMPDLKLKFDYIKVYSGDELDINSMQLGLRYVF